MNPARARRAKNVSEKLRVVSEGDKREVAKARLDALENDDALPAEDQAAGSDEEFQVEESDEEGGLTLGGNKKKKRRKGGSVAQRRTRAGLTESRGPKSLALLLEEAEVDLQPGDQPTYLTSAAGPSRVAAPRHWCTVCGFKAPYTCTRCGSRFCSRKCYSLHSETRCLKFTN